MSKRTVKREKVMQKHTQKVSKFNSVVLVAILMIEYRREQLSLLLHLQT